MIYRFLILSDEVADFKREIKIDSEATFFDLYNTIIESVGYTKDEMCSFFICDDDWSKRTEVTLIEMDTSADEDNYTMEDTRLEELLEDEHQRLMFVFDYMTERAFFMELREIIPGQGLLDPVVSKSVGNPPAQTVDFDKMEAETVKSTDLDEDFYGDTEYDASELDEDGFGELGDESLANPYDDDRY